MQADLSGNFLFIYSERYATKCNPETKESIYQLDDAFGEVKIIRIDKISCVDVDFNNMTLKIHVDGMSYPIYCSFGERNCYKINCFHDFLDVIHKALKCDYTKGFDILFGIKRDKQTQLSVTPEDYVREKES